MKMPRHPFYPVDLPPDIFGLRQLTILNQASETTDETQKRVAAVERGVVAAFSQPLALATATSIIHCCFSTLRFVAGVNASCYDTQDQPEHIVRL